MNKKQKEIYQYAAKVTGAIKEMLNNEESEFYVDLTKTENGEATPFLTGMCMAHLTLLLKFCGTKGSLLDAIHLENLLIVQYLMEYGEINDEKAHQ